MMTLIVEAVAQVAGPRGQPARSGSSVSVVGRDPRVAPLRYW
jgi:hypothetical protein